MGNIYKSWNIKEGWKPNTKGEMIPSNLPVGVWAKLIRKEISQHLRFNEITMLAELYGKPIAPEILDELYIELGERGWTITKGQAKDALVKVARSNSYNPITEYLLDILQIKPQAFAVSWNSAQLLKDLEELIIMLKNLDTMWVLDVKRKEHKTLLSENLKAFGISELIEAEAVMKKLTRTDTQKAILSVEAGYNKMIDAVVAADVVAVESEIGIDSSLIVSEVYGIEDEEEDVTEQLDARKLDKTENTLLLNLSVHTKSCFSTAMSAHIKADALKDPYAELDNKIQEIKNKRKSKKASNGGGAVQNNNNENIRETIGGGNRLSTRKQARAIRRKLRKDNQSHSNISAQNNYDIKQLTKFINKYSLFHVRIRRSCKNVRFVFNC